MCCGSMLAMMTDVTCLIRRLRSASGYTLTDIMMTVAISATVMAVALPSARNATDSIRVSGSGRDVERELQTARLKAVSANRTMRVRLNCPQLKQFRTVEITGVTTTDSMSNRCDPVTFPYPGPKDDDPATPEADGPVRFLHPSLTLNGFDIQFSPDGGAMKMVDGVATPIGTTPVMITVTYASTTSKVTVNALGKIQLQR